MNVTSMTVQVWGGGGGGGGNNTTSNGGGGGGGGGFATGTYNTTSAAANLACSIGVAGAGGVGANAAGAGGETYFVTTGTVRAGGGRAGAAASAGRAGGAGGAGTAGTVPFYTGGAGGAGRNNNNGRGGGGGSSAGTGSNGNAGGVGGGSPGTAGAAVTGGGIGGVGGDLNSNGNAPVSGNGGGGGGSGDANSGSRTGGAGMVGKIVITYRTNQAIIFNAAPIVVVEGTGTVSATGGGSGNAVTFTSTTPTQCTAGGTNGATITGVAAGTNNCIIAANQAADAGPTNWNAAPQVTQTFSIGMGSQTIAFGTAPTVVVGGTGTVTATGGASGNAVTFTSTTTGVCTATGTNGATITGVTAGTCTIAANQLGNANYNAATTVNQSFTIGKGSQTIAFGAQGAHTYSPSGTFALSPVASATSGLAIAYTSTTPGVCTIPIAGTTVTIVTAGTCTIAANQTGDTNWNAAPQVAQSITINKANQAALTVIGPTSVTYGNTGALTFSGGSGTGAVTYSSSTPAVCTVSSTTLTVVTATGTCTVTVTKAADTNYNSATSAPFTVTLNKANQTIGAITFTPTTLEVGGTTTASATATSGLAVAFTSTTGTVCTATGTNGATINGVSAGTCTIAANQTGNANYNAASPTVTQDITVNVPNCTSKASGNWNAPATWILCRNGIPLAGDAVTILATHTVTLNITTPILGNVTNGGTLNASGNTLNIGGNFTNTGTTSLGSAIVNLNGDFTNNSGANFNLGSAETGTWNFLGTALQNINSSDIFTTFPNLVLNNSFGIALNASTTIKTLLTLTGGYISTGGNILILSANCNAPSWLRTTGFVAGNVRLTFPTGTTTCTYPVGSGANYAPINITMMASTGGTLTGSTTGAEHPQIATSGIDSTLDVNRFWTLWMTGDTVAATSYGATFNFVPGDKDALATATNFVVGKYAASAWTLPTTVTATATSTGFASVAGPISATTDFAAGEKAFVCSVPADLPSNMSCQCDNFNRASVNPSTIFGGNYTLTEKSPVLNGAWPKIVTSGRLQMTDNAGNYATSATIPGTFPAAGNLVSVEFRHYAYKTGGAGGADGIAVTLSDSSITPAAGAFGGSLGYAQKDNAACAPLTPPCNGFAGGWIGVAIDEYGNFSNPTEGRAGPTGGAQTPESVAVRGSGNGLAGYPFLGGTGPAPLSPVVDNTSSATAAPGYAYRVQVDARCYLNNTATYAGNFALNCATANPTAAKWAKVRVYRDTTGAGNFGAPLTNLNFEAYAAAIAALPSAIQADVPATWRLSYTGSTGATTNFHEIGALKICAQTITPPSGYRIQVDNLTPSTCGTAGGPTFSPIVTVTALDTNGNAVIAYDKTVTLSAPLSGGGASSATWSLKSGHGTFTAPNQYTYVAADLGVAQFYLTDASPQSVTVGVSENGGTISSSLAPPPIVYAGGSFAFANIDALAADTGGGVVAGRPHKMSITRSNGCTTDTNYTGVKNLDGWYTPAAGDHPTGALAPQLCATNISGTCLPTPGACQTLSIAPPQVDPNNNNMPALTFGTAAPGSPPNGVAYFCLATSDVGKYSVSLRDDSAASVVGSSGTLTARPFAVVVSGVKQGATNNPAESGSGGNIFTTAGSSFEATVGGYLWSSTGSSNVGNGDANGDGVPDTGALLNQVIIDGLTTHYADTVTLAVDTSAPATPGSLTGGSVTVTGGSGSSSTLSYSEIGSFTLKATPASSYLSSGVDLRPRVVIFSTPSTPPGTVQNKWVGRFIPHHFGITGSVVTRSDLQIVEGQATPFTYMDEPMKLSLTITAQNASGDTTQNYSDATGYSKLNAATLGTGANWFNTGCTGSAKCMGLGAVNGTTTGLTDRLAMVPSGTYGLVADPTISWALGIGTVSAHVKLARSASPDGPFETLQFGAMPRDADGVTAASPDLDAATRDTATFGNPNGTPERRLIATTKARFGRLRLVPGQGSELNGYVLPVEAQYWNGAWITNRDDSLTTFTTSNVSVSGVGTPPSSVAAVKGGFGSIRLGVPTGRGTATICLDLGTTTGCDATTPGTQEFLGGNWLGGAFTIDPSAVVYFGRPRPDSLAPWGFIYQRENF